MQASASFQGSYSMPSVVWLDYLLIEYNYFMTSRRTVQLLSRVSGEVLRKPGATVPQIFSITEGLWLTVPQVAMKLMFYYPIVFKKKQHNTVNSTPTLVVDVGHSRCLSIRHHRFHRKHPSCLIWQVISPFILMKSCRNYSVKVNFTSKFG